MTSLIVLFAATTITAQTTLVVDFEDRTVADVEPAIG